MKVGRGKRMERVKDTDGAGERVVRVREEGRGGDIAPGSISL